MQVFEKEPFAVITTAACATCSIVVLACYRVARLMRFLELEVTFEARKQLSLLSADERYYKEMDKEQRSGGV